jgi:hypothetical protein
MINECGAVGGVRTDANPTPVPLLSIYDSTSLVDLGCFFSFLMNARSVGGHVLP